MHGARVRSKATLSTSRNSQLEIHSSCQALHERRRPHHLRFPKRRAPRTKQLHSAPLRPKRESSKSVKPNRSWRCAKHQPCNDPITTDDEKAKYESKCTEMTAIRNEQNNCQQNKTGDLTEDIKSPKRLRQRILTAPELSKDIHAAPLTISASPVGFFNQRR
jgi:hypothetical protein